VAVPAHRLARGVSGSSYAPPKQVEAIPTRVADEGIVLRDQRRCLLQLVGWVERQRNPSIVRLWRDMMGFAALYPSYTLRA
jgi:hypothetical protein